MRTFLFLCSLCLCLPLVSLAAPASSAPFVKDGKLMIVKAGKTQTLSDAMVVVKPVQGKDWFFVEVQEDAKETYGLAEGLYLFNKLGKLEKMLPANLDIGNTDSVSFSPAGDMLAVDTGTSPIRDMVFFRYPDFQLLTRTRYFDKLAWASGKSVVFSRMDTESKRTCSFDPCGPVSVMYQTVSKDENKETTLLQGTLLCDYSLESFDAATGVVTADKLCLPSAKAWEEYSGGGKHEVVTVQVPK